MRPSTNFLKQRVKMQSMQKTAKMPSCKFFCLLNEIALETKAHKSFVIETTTKGQKYVHSLMPLMYAFSATYLVSMICLRAE